MFHFVFPEVNIAHNAELWFDQTFLRFANCFTSDYVCLKSTGILLQIDVKTTL